MINIEKSEPVLGGISIEYSEFTQQAVNDNVIRVNIWYNTRVRGNLNAIISRKEIHIC